MLISKGLVHDTDDIDTEIMQGPFTEAQARIVDALISRLSAKTDMTEVDMTSAIETIANVQYRRRYWVESIFFPSHFCPGYYDCLVCVPD